MAGTADAAYGLKNCAILNVEVNDDGQAVLTLQKINGNINTFVVDSSYTDRGLRLP
jgi:hypothetical protein